jgi:hypothetical protein
MNPIEPGGLSMGTQRELTQGKPSIKTKPYEAQSNGISTDLGDSTNEDTRKLNPDSLQDNSTTPSNRHAQERRLKVMEVVDQFRFNCGMLVNNPKVEFTIVIFIAVNAIMMGIGTYSFVRESEQLDHVFEVVDLTFLIIFTTELALQFVYHGWRLLLDGWLVFDLLIITLSWSFASTQIVRAFRIFRALRLVTRIKTMKNLILGT